MWLAAEVVLAASYCELVRTEFLCMSGRRGIGYTAQYTKLVCESFNSYCVFDDHVIQLLDRIKLLIIVSYLTICY